MHAASIFVCRALVNACYEAPRFSGVSEHFHQTTPRLSASLLLSVFFGLTRLCCLLLRTMCTGVVSSLRRFGCPWASMLPCVYPGLNSEYDSVFPISECTCNRGLKIPKRLLALLTSLLLFFSRSAVRHRQGAPANARRPDGSILGSSGSITLCINSVCFILQEATAAAAPGGVQGGDWVHRGDSVQRR